MKPFLLLQSRPEKLAAQGELKAILDFSGLQPEQLKNIHINEVGVPAINLDEYSGVIVGGGPWNVSDSSEEKTPEQIRAEEEIVPLLDQIIERDFPYLGICLGLGLLVRHLGGNVTTDAAEVLTAYTIQLTEAGAADPLLAHIPDSFQAFVGHHEGSKAAPKGAVVLATTQTCPVQMIRVRENIYATQFHVELDSEHLIERAKIYKNYGYFEPEELGSLINLARLTSITAPLAILRSFVTTYSTSK